MPENPQATHPRDQPTAIAVRMALVEENNSRVERDKIWETSVVRCGAITITIYCVAVIFLLLIAVPNIWLAACVPAGGYIFSTLSLPLLKKVWIQTCYTRPTK